MEWVVKVGGSLFPKKAIELVKSLKNTKILIVVGGGEFANLIRKYDGEVEFSNDISHETAIDSMEIMAKLLNDKIDFTKIVYTIEEAKKASSDGFIPILIVSKLLKENDPLKHSWEVTSDSISAYIANLLKAKLLISTNVKGIYTRNPSHQDAIFIDEINAKNLLTFDESSIDLMLPKLLLRFGIDCFVVNGNYPMRVLSIINSDKNHNFQYTLIKGGD
ncbi:MAG: delta 1-pyrroline-5-carboxylate synthetase [Methanobrevibacter sp.]|nr:delta 1-pyrroline-5-carboxylate synthetase [Methanobrevibacter sp.]